MQLFSSIAMVTITIASFGAGEAEAANPCRALDRAGAKVRVVVAGGVPCHIARNIVTQFYSLASVNRRSVVPEIEINGFRCFGGADFTQVICTAGKRRLAASSRQRDNPKEWLLPRSKVQLGSSAAAHYMKAALSEDPTLQFMDGDRRRIECRKAVSKLRRRCTMVWSNEDSRFSGSGTIWITFGRGVPFWAARYRVKRCTASETPSCEQVIRR